MFYLASAARVKFAALDPESGGDLRAMQATGRQEATAESDIPHTDAFCNLNWILVEFVGPTAQRRNLTRLSLIGHDRLVFDSYPSLFVQCPGTR